MNEDLRSLLDMPLPELTGLADSIRSQHTKDRIELCSITNAKSGRCTEDCRFCAQSMHFSTDIKEYPLKTKEIMVREAEEAKRNGAEYFSIVTSGNALNGAELESVADTVKDIVKTGVKACASLGALEFEQLKVLKDAGLARYHHNIETSGSFYHKIVSTHSFEDRLSTIKAAKSAGLEVCSGGIIGMGESWADRYEMALTLRDLNVDAVPLNILTPIKGTPLEDAGSITPLEALKTIAIFRVIMKDKMIKLAAGRETKLGERQADAFMAGASGMMIGGYLTTRGRSVSQDQQLVEEVMEAWKTKSKLL